MKKFSSKITVLVCVRNFESYGSLSENFLQIEPTALDPSVKSRFISKFSRFSKIKNGHWKIKNLQKLFKYTFFFEK